MYTAATYLWCIAWPGRELVSDPVISQRVCREPSCCFGAWTWIECVVIYRYFRSGAPPVINPLLTRFPRDTVVPGSFAVTLTWTLPNRTTGAFNVSSPLPGDWFLAAHLPKDEGKISVKVRPVVLIGRAAESDTFVEFTLRATAGSRHHVWDHWGLFVVLILQHLSNFLSLASSNCGFHIISSFIVTFNYH